MSALILGIGNLIMSDDSLGVRLVESLRERYRFPKGVNLEEGGTLGPELLPLLEGVERLLVVDAIDNGATPGRLIRLTGADIPMVMGAKLSPHQFGLTDLLAVATLQEMAPPEIVVWGIQPGHLGMGLEFSAPVAAGFAELEKRVLQELRDWGIQPVPLEPTGQPSPCAQCGLPLSPSP